MVSDTYWARRSKMYYYAYACDLIRAFGAESKSMIDVGSGNARYMEEFYWIETRHALDKTKAYSSDCVTAITANFLTFEPQRKYDFAVCMQVLEHVKPAGRFAAKLFEVADRVLISVPLQWPAGRVPGHINDPVDLEKLRTWTGRDPSYAVVVAEPLQEDSSRNRLIAYYHPAGTEFSLAEFRNKQRPKSPPAKAPPARGGVAGLLRLPTRWTR